MNEELLSDLPERVLLQLLDEDVEDSIKKTVRGLVPRAALDPRSVFDEIKDRCGLLDVPAADNHPAAKNGETGCFISMMKHPIATNVSMRSHWFEFSVTSYRLHWLPWGRIHVPIDGVGSFPPGYLIQEAHGEFWGAINGVSQGLFAEDARRSLDFEVVWYEPSVREILSHL